MNPVPIRSHRPHEAGTAYLIVMGALAVLSILGLAVLFVTQTEYQIGGAERVTNRVFYAADTGIAVATARALVDGAYNPITLSVRDPSTGLLIASTTQVSLSPFYPINDQPCNLCEINDAGEYSDHSYRKVNHAVTVTATRQGVPFGSPAGTPGVNVAQKLLTTMVEIQPWRSSTDAYAAAVNPTQLATIHF